MELVPRSTISLEIVELRDDSIGQLAKLLRAYCPNINTVLLVARAAPVIWLDEYRSSEIRQNRKKKSHIDFRKR